MRTENKLTTNHKPMQGCVTNMKIIKKIKKTMTTHKFLYSGLIDNYKSRYEQIRTKVATSKHHTTSVYIVVITLLGNP